jgi:cell division protein FtsZ
MLENAVIAGARGILVSFTSAKSLKLSEIQEAMEYIRKSSNPDAFIKFGQADDETMGEELKITVIATGFPSRPKSDLSIDLERHRYKKRPRPSEDFFDGIGISGLAGGSMSDEDLDKPAFMRRKTGGRKLK